MMRNLVFASLLFPTVLGLTCTVCEFKLLPPHSTSCNETCEGDVCFIVVNKFFNGTINAGCMHLRDDDKFTEEAVCQRTAYDNRCACDTGDKCNDPKAKLSSFTFTENPVLGDYQWVPQIQPSMATVRTEEPLDLDPLNGTVLSNDEEIIKSSELEAIVTDNRNKTDTESEEQLLTVTTTVGINEGMSSHGSTRGWGTIEMANVTQYRGAPAPNISVVRDENDPNSSQISALLLALLVPLVLLL
ncbi:unnamed protein product [Caenorhabditis bovis]|uniref:UPAR/Ly6 domain-containing protein n=1 Tax=Caenorhabditis bovis TaxID=2654633 RepID=A0A8S1ETP7_9PELO|nr:unnamed protein product [Caenorhabditis bovis]